MTGRMVHFAVTLVEGTSGEAWAGAPFLDPTSAAARAGQFFPVKRVLFLEVELPGAPIDGDYPTSIGATVREVPHK